MIIAPSFLSADFAHLEREIEMLNKSEADMLHFDVMDGSFVPNISFGFPVMASLQPVVRKPMDVHMMVVHPEQWIEKVASYGAEYMTVHQEACHNLHRCIQQIHEAGMKAGVAINPGTPNVMLDEVLCDLDLVLIMTVNPGFGGQKFIPCVLRKIESIAETAAKRGLDLEIEVDGGVKVNNAADVINAGATVLVAGTAVITAPDPVLAVKQLKGCA